jgi:predicted benzoate:H+ symporter BenE
MTFADIILLGIGAAFLGVVLATGQEFLTGFVI